MRIFLLVLSGLIGVTPVAWSGGYEDKPDTNTNYVAEPLLPQNTSSAQKQEGDYPYYGNAPENLFPYRNIEPYIATGSRASRSVDRAATTPHRPI